MPPDDHLGVAGAKTLLAVSRDRSATASSGLTVAFTTTTSTVCTAAGATISLVKAVERHEVVYEASVATVFSST
jgi:hypothetical protein